MKCIVCTCFIPNIETHSTDDECRVFKDICEPCTCKIALIPDYLRSTSSRLNYGRYYE